MVCGVTVLWMELMVSRPFNWFNCSLELPRLVCVSDILCVYIYIYIYIRNQSSGSFWFQYIGKPQVSVNVVKMVN